jgi:hypothetical protein
VIACAKEDERGNGDGDGGTGFSDSRRHGRLEDIAKLTVGFVEMKKRWIGRAATLVVGVLAWGLARLLITQ